MIAEDQATTWAPEMRIRYSKRARRVQLKVSVADGLELVLPDGCKDDTVDAFLLSKRSWIDKHLAWVESERSKQNADQLPTEISLLALQEKWQVTYIANTGKTRLLFRPHQELVVFGDIENKSHCKKLLIDWCRGVAEKHLLSLLQEISHECQLPFKSATIRGQKSRWGSCSIDKEINLNYKLLFLPPHLVRHVLIHELCHTIEMNHSARFWRQVARFDPDWQTLRRESRHAQAYVPLWLEVNSF